MDTLRQKIVRRLSGLAFIAVLFGLVSLSVLVYNKAFTDFVSVKVAVNSTGNQLAKASDVKVRGIIVGSVKSIHTTGQGVTLELNIDKSKAKLIPDNSLVQILPKTLFGEQYVAVQLPSDPGPHVTDGDTLKQDTSAQALEAQRVFGDLLPLLQAVEPAQLNATLTAFATALEGRGTELGQTLVALDTYLKGLNPAVPQMVQDLDALGKVALSYNAATPDIVATLQNLQTPSRTLIEKQAAFDQLLVASTDTSNLLESFLANNASRLITVSDTSATTLSLLARYSPEYQCVITGMNELRERLVVGMRAQAVHLSAQLYNSPPNGGKYVPGNEPRLVTGYGPNCFGLPNPQMPFRTPGKYRCLNDGAPLTTDPCAQTNTTAASDQQALGSPTETALIDAVIAPTYGSDPAKVPDIAAVLAAPALRGSEVTLQ